MRRASHEHKSLRAKDRAGRLLAAASVLSSAIASSAYGVVRHVDASAPVGVNDGVTWGTAFIYVKNAIAVAVSGDEIWVAQGTYRPDQSASNPGGSNLRSDTFSLKEGVKIYAGFPTGGGAGGLDDPAARNPEVYITTLSGDIGTPGVTGDNSFHVVTAQGVTTTAKLNGFRIVAGNADAGVGGGMRICNGSPQIVRCIFSSNLAGSGGAVGFDGPLCAGSPLFVNCSFLNNMAQGGDGGAMYVTGGEVTCHNGVFDSNAAPDTSVGGHGGGIFVGCGTSAGTIQLRNCTFSRNIAGQAGGAIAWAYCQQIGCCLKSDIINSILWNDSAPVGSEIRVFDTLVPGIDFCDVQGGWPAGTNSITADPKFVNPTAGNLRLRNVCPVVSPCIDAGSDGAVPADVADVDDNSGTTILPWDRDKTTSFTHSHHGRVLNVATGAGTKVDMGAFESQHIAALRWDIDGSSMGPWPDYVVGVNDFFLLLQDWSGLPCPGCGADFNYDSQVAVNDELDLLAHWCSPCRLCSQMDGQGAAAASANSESESSFSPVDAALAVMGFSSLDDYGAWMEQASAAEVYASSVVLAVLLGG